MSVQRNNETGKQSSGSGSGGRGPNWLGWIVILAVIGMMGAALVLSVDRMREIPIASGPTATPRPRIGSIAVEPQVEPGENDTGDATVDVAGGEGEAAAQPVGEAGDMPSGSETESAGAATGAQAGTISSAGTGAMSTAPEGEPDSGVELLIVGPIIIPAAPASVRLEGLGVAPTATGVAAAAVTVGDAASATSAFGRIRTSEDTATTEPDSSGAPADAGDVLPATSPESTETPLPTVTQTAVPTDVPTQTPTETPTTAPTATPVPTQTPAPTETSTETPLPTATETTAPTSTPTSTPTTTLTDTPTAAPTATPTATETTAPTATVVPTATIPVEDLPVQVPPGSTVVGNIQVLAMRLDASPSAAIMETYGIETRFDVLEPVSPFDSYPVKVGGLTWLRVRAEDGLVGWIDATDVIVEE